PLAGDRASDLLRRLGEAGPVAVYDPEGQASLFNLFYDLEELVTAGTYVQAVTQAGRPVLGHPAQLITELPRSGAGTLLVAAFDAERTIGHIRHLLPEGCTVASFDALRLPATMLSNPKRTLDPNNYATNFVFFRSTDDDRMRLVTVNYWAGYGASSLRLWCRLYDTAGQVLAEWEEPVAPGISTTTLDSAEVRRRFDLPPFTGQLFVHAIGATGHDMVKYALDTLGGEGDPLECFSATHDANAWPADFYGGLPAPRDGEQVILWLQNSHPTAIPAGAIGLARMGEEAVRTLPLEIPPFGTHPLSVADLFPEDRWPTQYEVHAGRHFVRPRYEVLLASGRRCVAHINVERTDLKPDPALASLPKELG
ncbi:MAG TPA: hypothetical protein VEI97_15675, partial [bacterium]|nr:hypothetical protein [bacterium]